MIIGIGGVSRSGKTVLAKHLATCLVENGKQVSVLHQDDLVVDQKLMPKIKGELDWEHPSSIDYQKIISLIAHQKNQYDYLLIEGLFAFANEELNKLYDKGIYLHIDRATFVKRKLEDERWGGEPEWYLDHIWDAHQRYGRPGKVQCQLLHLRGTDIDFKIAELFIQ
jgi:nicotinamide/nicotinate riboside kinase